MALAYDASNSVYQGSTVASQNLALTVSGSNRIIVVATRTYDGDGVSGVTYAGQALTEIGSAQALGTDRFRLWYRLAPTTGANNVTATISPNRRIEIYAISFTGAKQTGQPDASSAATGSSTSATAAVTTVADSCLVAAFAEANGAGGAWSSGTNCTVVSSINDRGAVGWGGPKTPAGSFTQAIGVASTGGWGFRQVSIAPATTSDYTVAAAQGSFSLTGQAAAFRKAVGMAAAQGSLALTGFAASLRKGYGILAAMGTVALSGPAAALNSARSLAAAQGGLALTGVAAALAAARRMAASAGSLALTGFAAQLYRKGWGRPGRDATTFGRLARVAAAFTRPSRPAATWTRPDNPAD